MSEMNEPSEEDSKGVPTHSAGNRKRRRGEDATFKCPQCQRVFGRIEHLRRHANSHGEERSFKCSVCGKGFNRLDTLQRHELIHQRGISRTKGTRACRECASAKAHCNGSLPCERCGTKSLECFYPNNAASPSQGSPSSGVSDTIPTPGAGSSEAYSTSLLDSTTFPRQLEHALPRVGDSMSFSDQDSIYSADTWAYQSNPEWISSPAYASNPTINHGMPGHDHNVQQFTFSPPGGAFLNMSASFEQQNLFHRERHSSMNQLIRPRLVANARTRTAIQDSDSPASQAASVDSRMFPDDELRASDTIIHDIPATRGPSLRPFSVSINPSSKRRQFEFPLLRDSHPVCRNEAYFMLDLLSEESYGNIYNSFTSLCIGITAQSPAYRSSNFPSLQTLNTFIQLYLEHFHPLMPILHHPSLDLNVTPWLLSLALATVGSHFAEYDHSEEYSSSLDELLRRATSALDIQDGFSRTVLCQIKLLNCICLLYSGEESWQSSAYHQFCELVSFCRLDWKSTEEIFASSLIEVQPANTWQRWADVESRRRTGYAIWLLDTMWAYQFQVQPLLTLEDGIVPLPCQEVLWEAKTAEQWRHVVQYSAPSPTLISAIQSMDDERRLQLTIGEFSRIILIHGLYQRSWNMDNPRHRIHMFALWQDSVCDHLDMLHWSADNVVTAAGVEHPTVLHLHLARIVLFAPFGDICNLAYGVTKEDPSINAPQIADLRMKLRKWAFEEDRKARLAAMHAGAILRHLRHYHTGGFYEPSAILLATLALWAYGTFSTTTSASGPMLQRRYSDTQKHPTGITLDHMIEPELARLFVREGRDIVPVLSGVGSICRSGAPEHILLEGSKLVSTIGRWGSGRKVMRILNTLSLCRQYTEIRGG